MLVYTILLSIKQRTISQVFQLNWDYDITEQRRSIMQRAKDLFLNNTLKIPKHQKSSNG